MPPTGTMDAVPFHYPYGVNDSDAAADPTDPTDPTYPTNPTNPEYPAELPDPNDPNSPEVVTILEEGVPKTYRKVWDPEHQTWVYIPEEDTPLGIRFIPKTGDRTGLWELTSLLALLGLAVLRLVTRRGRKKHA